MGVNVRMDIDLAPLLRGWQCCSLEPGAHTLVRPYDLRRRMPSLDVVGTDPIMPLVDVVGVDRWVWLIGTGILDGERLWLLGEGDRAQLAFL